MVRAFDGSTALLLLRVGQGALRPSVSIRWHGEGSLCLIAADCRVSLQSFLLQTRQPGFQPPLAVLKVFVQPPPVVLLLAVPHRGCSALLAASTQPFLQQCSSPAILAPLFVQLILPKFKSLPLFLLNSVLSSWAFLGVLQELSEF